MVVAKVFFDPLYEYELLVYSLNFWVGTLWYAMIEYLG